VIERLRLRPATAADAAIVMSFIRDLAAYEKLLDEVIATPADIERALFAQQPRVFCDIAEWDGAPAGFALWFYNFSTFRGRHGIYLEDLFVKPVFRGHGIGKALLVNLARRAVREGCARVEWSVLDWNEPSINFYKSLGAVPLDEWTIFRLAGDALQSLGRA
jgi:GNAT superfamily N-acetyltransferase